MQCDRPDVTLAKVPQKLVILRDSVEKILV